MSALTPLIASWIAGALLLLLDGRRRSVAALAVFVLGAVLTLDLVLLAAGGTAEVVAGGWPAGVGIRLRIDRGSLAFAALSTFVLAVVMAHEARQRVLSRLFPAMLVTLCAALHGAFFTADLFDFYVFFELCIVTSFGLSAYGYGKAEIRGALTYVVVNLIGSVLFLVGIASAYQVTGTLDVARIAAASRGGAELLVAAALVFSGLSLKVGLFPFHAWAPVLYSHARPSIAAALAGALVNVGTYALVRFGFGMLDEARRSASPLLVALGLLSTLYGALVAMHRTRPAEIAAYASVAQAGYVVMALGIGGPHAIGAA
ncbi:MAG TPA: proton-conducting transporter membrane subunit, partial [Sandaracinaceae bacterium]